METKGEKREETVHCEIHEIELFGRDGRKTFISRVSSY